MRTLVYVVAASWLVFAPASADEGRTGRGADADGRGAAQAEQAAQERADQSSTAALVMVSALVEQLVEEGALSKDGAARVMERAKAGDASGLPDIDLGQQD